MVIIFKLIENIKKNGTPRSYACKPVMKEEKPTVTFVPDPQINYFSNKIDPYKNQIKVITLIITNNYLIKQCVYVFKHLGYKI